MTHQIRMKVYIAGPMTGLPDDNYPAFRAAARNLSLVQNFIVLDPSTNKGTHWIDYMRASLRMIADADCLYMLKGWEGSKGARLEHQLALDLHLPIFYEPQPQSTLAKAVGEGIDNLLSRNTKEVSPGVKEGWTASQREAALAEQAVRAAAHEKLDAACAGTLSADHPSTGQGISKQSERFVVQAVDVFEKWVTVSQVYYSHEDAERGLNGWKALCPGLPLRILPVKKPV